MSSYDKLKARKGSLECEIAALTQQCTDAGRLLTGSYRGGYGTTSAFYLDAMGSEKQELVELLTLFRDRRQEELTAIEAKLAAVEELLKED